MEKKVINKIIRRTFLIILLLWVIGLAGGYILEIIWPSAFSIQILSEDAILKNNYSQLIKTIIIGMSSLGIGCVPFIISVGGTVGEGIFIIAKNYGTTGIIKGFLPHAIIEMLSCYLAAGIPLFFWQSILEFGVKKNDYNKKGILNKAVVRILFMFVVMTVSCYLAAYLECNISEIYWEKVK